MSGGTEILWDTWGVPHIFARDARSLFYAFGWAQMKSHGDLILRLYGHARGRAAEYWGESYVDSDRYVRTMDVPNRARMWYESQRPIFREYLDAFVDGMNAYAQTHPSRIDEDVAVVLPVEAVDVMAHVQRAVHLTIVGWQAIPAAEEWSSPGSNAWAISPSRSAGGNAMLLANPHLPWSDLFIWYEAQLTAPEVDAYGAALVGMPILAIAFNDYLGWTHTNNTLDGMDLYELSLADDGYIWNGAVQSFETNTQIIKVKQADGTLRDEELVVRRSLHGPVLAERGDRALAMRLVGLDHPHIMEQYWNMLRSKNIAEFETALRQLQLPYFNIVYADRDGHIMYLFGGHVPKRGRGDWDYWSDVIQGDTSATLWTETHPYDDLPRVIDPSSGWVQNANDPPWTSSFPMVLDPKDYPAYFSPRGMSFRAQRSVRMLNEDEVITFEDLIQYKHSTRMELADRILDDLIPAARNHGSDLARKAADVLTSWDRSADADSRGAVLFAAWVREVEGKLFAEPWSEDAPLVTPDGLADPAAAAAALAEAAGKLINDFGTIDVPWGEVYRLRYSGRDFPANGGPHWLGIFRVVDFSRDEDGRHRSSFGGDSYVAVIEFSDPVRAKVLCSYGNATQPDSPHNGDQLELFSRKDLRPVWRTRELIEAHLEGRDVF